MENWAYLANICHEYQDLVGQDVIARMVNRLVAKGRDVDNIDSMIDKGIRSKILLDEDTGLGNREFFDHRLDALLKEEGIQGAVYFIHFNEGELVYTLHGRTAVTQIFNQVIGSINMLLHKLSGCYLTRRGTYELALIAPGVYITEAEQLAQRMIKTLSSIALPIGVERDSFVHIGVSYFSQAENSYQIKSEADMALRSAQLQGPSQWFMFEPGEVEHVRAKGSLQWRTFLEKAIARNAFVLFFQPVLAATNEQSLHHEVLVKVRDEDGQLINARVFLPMAVKSGVIKEVDFLVLSQVCRLLNYDRHLTESCSLNLSIESLLSKNLLGKFKEILVRYPKISSQLIVEISEYHLVNEYLRLKPVLSQLQSLGVRLFIDKVGQYIESVDYLKECPISAIKLHASIVINIHQRSENQIFVKSLVKICQSQQVDIYAFGVECAEEWRTLKKLGVNGGQGHYFTEPMSQVAKAIHQP
ncbi:EAL domain-containing protein [Thalassotalea sp. 1_MG-2023]|uniref:EAL domain-containing protein n=1 Tax=Thalassotalea sp. 1_MG-2023 TaxID=3062680 RepID=UPI0026E2B845|nr:EAL domain-containing protein [Thalassotalea sp. 1_MG-2023]MDO6426284.1 EAL domain-containing protein [Thalassotalea sp. 1_MG-2023]